jgi:hypothetical protein
MSTKTKTPARATRRTPSAGAATSGGKAAGPPDQDGPAPGTTAWHLACIAALGQRVHEYVKLMAKARSTPSSSAEAIDRAVVAFHERLAVLEVHLGRIHEELHLG